MGDGIAFLVANDYGLPTSFYGQSLFEGIYPGPISVIIHAMAHHQLSNQKAIQALSEQTGDYPEAHRLLADVYTREGETTLAEQHMRLAATGGDLIAQKKLGSAVLEEKTMAFFSRENGQGRRPRTTYYGVPMRSQRIGPDSESEAPRFEIASLLEPETQDKKPENIEVDTLSSHAEPARRMG